MTDARAAAERAHAICVAHNAQYPTMANVPIQTVYEWLVQIQADAVAQAQQENHWTRYSKDDVDQLVAQAVKGRDEAQEEVLRLRDVEGLAWQTKVREQAEEIARLNREIKNLLYGGRGNG